MIENRKCLYPPEQVMVGNRKCLYPPEPNMFGQTNIPICFCIISIFLKSQGSLLSAQLTTNQFLVKVLYKERARKSNRCIFVSQMFSISQGPISQDNMFYTPKYNLLPQPPSAPPETIEIPRCITNFAGLDLDHATRYKNQARPQHIKLYVCGVHFSSLLFEWGSPIGAPF